MKIKSLGTAPTGNHWSYGPDFMRRIGKEDAKKLCSPYDLPKTGYQTRIEASRDYFGWLHFLEIQNISGNFYLACCSASVLEWPDLFGVEIVE